MPCQRAHGEPMAASAASTEPAGPIPFVTVDDSTGKFAIADEAVAYLRGLNPKRRLAIVSIAGEMAELVVLGARCGWCGDADPR